MKTEMQVLERLKETMVSQLNPLMEITDGVLPEDISAQNVEIDFPDTDNMRKSSMFYIQPDGENIEDLSMGSDIATMDSTVFILCKGATSTTLIKMVFGLKTEPQSAHMTLPQKGLHPYVNPSCSHCPAGPGRHRTVLL